MNISRQTAQRGPTAECKAFAALLPILDVPGIETRAAEVARTHLATCAYCRSQRASYQRLDTAIRQHLSPPATPRYQTEEILRDLLQELPIDAKVGTSPRPRVEASLRVPRPRRLLSGFASLAAVLALVLIAVTLFDHAPHQPGANTNSPTPPTQITVSSLYDIVMVSPTEGWAVGYTETWKDLNHVALDPLLLHYIHGSWSPIRLALQGELTSISMASATDGWASGLTMTNHALLLHYNGQHWVQVPSNSMQLAPIQMLSATDGWALTSGGIVHYDGHTWAPQPLPASLASEAPGPIELTSLAMISQTEGWATDQTCKLCTPTGAPNTVFLHYTGGQWETFQTIEGAGVDSIAMTSPTDGWATGYTATASQWQGTPTPTSGALVNAPLLLHYTQGTWKAVPVPQDIPGDREAILGQVFMNSATDGWIVGEDGENGGKAFFLHYNGMQWKVIQPAAIKNVLIAPGGSLRIFMTSATEGWAVGAQEEQDTPTSPSTALILHYVAGIWSIYNG